MPPPTVPTSRPGKRIDACRPPSTRRPGAVRHRARADHAEVLPGRGEDRGDRGRRRERDRLHARRDRAVRARPRERLEIGGRRPEHARDRLVGERRLGDHGLAVAGLEELERRLLVAAHVRLEHRRARSAPARSAARTPCSARTRCGSSCSARPRRRSSSARARGTSARRRASSPRAARRSATARRCRRCAGTRASRRRARRSSARASARRRRRLQTKHDARVIRSATTYVRKPPDSSTAFAPRCSDAVSPPSVCASGTTTSSLGAPGLDDLAVLGQRVLAERDAAAARPRRGSSRRRSPTRRPSRTARGLTLPVRARAPRGARRSRRGRSCAASGRPCRHSGVTSRRCPHN